MLFNSSAFLFAFLPLTVALFYMALRWVGITAAHGILLLASLWFYASGKPALLVLVIGSVLINYPISVRLARSSALQTSQRFWLVSGIGINLLVLGVFKYAGFFVENLNWLLGADFSVPKIALPLGISFLTFHQISYLVDVSQGKTRPAHFWTFSLYITFFPHLIAGPIVRHAELMPQLIRGYSGQWASNLSVGMTLFVMGLAKKVLLADPLALYASPAFTQVESGVPLAFTTAWLAVLAYTFQIYYDFSGYSDMAAGLARLFGLRLPINFNAPYRSTSVTEFWRRWHMTLSRFLRDYLYIPLGGNRHGNTRRLVNLATVMLLGGLWHGAGWTFVIWGGLHGCYLVLHQMWTRVGDAHFPHRAHNQIWRAIAWSATFLSVVMAWVFFRADSLQSALLMLRSLINPIWVPVDVFGLLIVALAFVLIFFAPTPAQIMARYRPVLPPVPQAVRWLVWRPSVAWAFVTSAMLFAVVCRLSQPSEFIYFRF